MDITVMDNNFNPLLVVDSYESFIWSDRFSECGDFEWSMAMPADNGFFDIVKIGAYLEIQESEHLMIIEKIVIESDAENGDHLKITGRSLESILDRRIVWGVLSVTETSISSLIRTMLTDAFISPTDSSRSISNFVLGTFVSSKADSILIDKQIEGENVYDVIKELCNQNGIGFKIILDSQNRFEFTLYDGADRSYDQIINDPVIFSPDFDNLNDSNYLNDETEHKTSTLIGGEKKTDEERKYTTVTDGSSGLARKEIFTDASNISSTRINESTGKREDIPEEEYIDLLKEKGTENLSDHSKKIAFEGSASTTATTYIYGRDFDIGDIVQVADKYGNELKARAVEVIISDEESGYQIYPTFRSLEEEIGHD